MGEIIVTEKEKRKIFYTIAMVFCIGGILSFGWGGENSVIEGIMYFVTGASMYLIQRIKKDKLKDTLTIILLVAYIPIVTFRYLEYASMTVWVFPVIIIIASLVFSKKTLLISTAVVSIITQRIIWILKPQITVDLGQYDYMFRIILFLTALAVGYYVNKMYVARIKENNFQMGFQKMNAKISSDFISINKQNADEKINELLSEMGLFFQADRTYLFTINYDETMTYSHEWCAEGIGNELKTIENIPLTTFPWWLDQLRCNNLVKIEDTSKMPKEAINEQEQLLRQAVKSLISVPVNGKSRMKAFVGIDSVVYHRKWTGQDVELLNILSNILSDGLARMKSEKEIEYMAYYDRLTNLPNRFLFKDRVKAGIKLCEKTGSWINIIFIDLDDFKTVNDTMGHEGGDYLLKEVANRLKNSVRKADTVARFGGDEFMIMLSNVDNQDHVSKIADQIMDVFTQPFNIYGQDFYVTASAGISEYPRDGKDPENLIKNADTAMYDAKSKGKNGYSFFSTK